MEQLQALEAYLVDSRQIDPLARRQAELVSRSLVNDMQRKEARIVLLLVFAALQKGTPRANAPYLLEPLIPDSITFHKEVYRSENGSVPEWYEPMACIHADVEQLLAKLFSAPDCFAPLSGTEPGSDSVNWPLLVVSNNRTGFSRYWKSARMLEKELLPAMVTRATEHPDDHRVRKALEEVFVNRSILTKKERFHYRQIAAAALSCRTGFMVLSGGPGTGKTSVVLQILRTLLRVFPQLSADRMVLCAPTGRAKARLGESIDIGLHGLATQQTVEAGSIDASLHSIHRKTIHSLIGQQPDGSFKYHRDNRLPFQVVVIDEASMVDLNLFAALLDSCNDDCRLLLIGDMHQLPSVEAGAVLGDCTAHFSDQTTFASITPGTAAWIDRVTAALPADRIESRKDMVLAPDTLPGNENALADRVVILSHSYRSTPAILDLATMINRGDTAGALGFLSGGDEGSPVSIDTTTGSEPIEEWIRSQLTEPSVDEAYRLLANPPEGAEYSPDVTAAITTVLFNATMLVLAHEGPRGRKAINRLAAAGLRRKLHNPPGDRFFHGMPIILGSNHHELDLYNGDIGIVLHTKNEGTKVFFPRGDRLHPVSLDRLIDPEPAFALTVHKSQGSEFNAVLLVLPEHESPLLSRQIIYTGITRAKKYLKILGSTSILAAAINRVEKREGGLQLS